MAKDWAVARKADKTNKTLAGYRRWWCEAVGWDNLKYWKSTLLLRIRKRYG